MMNIVCDVLICMFETFIFYDFFHDILEKRTENRGIILTVLAVMTAILYGMKLCYLSQANFIGGFLLFFCGSIVLFDGNKKTQILYFRMFYLILAGMEFVAEILCVVITSSDLISEKHYPLRKIILISITKLFTYVILRFMKQFLNSKDDRMRGNFLKMAFWVPLTTMLLYAGLYYADVHMEKGRMILCMGCVLLLISNIMVFYMIEKLTIVMEQNSAYECMDLQNRLNHTHYERLEEVEEKQRQYAHNLKEYLQTISVLATKSKSEEIVDILKDMEVEVDSISDKIYTDNRILNALICEKELQAQKREIEIHIMIEPGLCLKSVKNGDLIVMVGNLLDNAIEAAALCKEQKRIDLKFFSSDGNFLVLDIENTYGNTIKMKGDSYLSTKKDSLYHGIGIKSVRETAEKYGGMLFQEPKEDIFISILTLSKAI